MDKKKWWQSKTILSGIFVVALSVVKAVDAHYATNLLNTEIVTALTGIAAAFGVYGRTVSKTVIK